MLGRVFPWASKHPSFASIILALIAAALGQIFKTYGVLGPLAQFTAYLEDSLRSFDVTNISATFYRELTGCGFDSGALACEPGPDASDRLQDSLLGRPQNGLIGGILVAVINTVAIVFGQATWLGMLIYLVLLIAAGVAVATILDIEDSGLVGVLLIIVLTPAAASIAALGLKWLLLLFIVLFSQVLAGIMWFVTTFGTFIAWAKAGNAVLSSAHKIDKLANSLGPPPNPPKV